MTLILEDIKKSFGDGENKTEVLKGISCEIKDGNICVLLGPSGSGKSTLLNIIGGIENSDSGKIKIGDEVVGEMKEKKLTQYRRKHLGYVFQSYNLIPNLTVKENIEVGAYLSDKPLDIDELLKTLGLWEHKDKIPNQLSGGQQQRVSIGRALANNPALLLADEPTGNLDSENSKEIVALLRKFNREHNQTVIMITHDERIAQSADRIIAIEDGKIVKDEVSKG